MADQFRGDAMGCMGKEPVQTPNLDRLASEGILFTDAVSSYPGVIARTSHADDGNVSGSQRGDRQL